MENQCHIIAEVTGSRLVPPHHFFFQIEFFIDDLLQRVIMAT